MLCVALIRFEPKAKRLKIYLIENIRRKIAHHNKMEKYLLMLKVEKYVWYWFILLFM